MEIPFTTLSTSSLKPLPPLSFDLISQIKMSSTTLSTMVSDESLSSQEDTMTIPCEEFGYTPFGVEDVEKAKRCDNGIARKPSMVEQSLLPRVYKGALPHQSDCTRWLSYLPGLVIVKIGVVLMSTELTTQLLLKSQATSTINSFVAGVWNDPCATNVVILLTFLAIASMVVNDVLTFVFLIHGKRRRSLPAQDRLVHAVIITQYKEVRCHLGKPE
jgi:hypothetical protein